MSSLVCGLDVHKDRVYATVMSYGGQVIEKKRLSNDGVVDFLGRYPIDGVAMQSSTSIVPVYRALRGRGYEIRDQRWRHYEQRRHQVGYSRCHQYNAMSLQRASADDADYKHHHEYDLNDQVHVVDRPCGRTEDSEWISIGIISQPRYWFSLGNTPPTPTPLMRQDRTDLSMRELSSNLIVDCEGVSTSSPMLKIPQSVLTCPQPSRLSCCEGEDPVSDRFRIRSLHNRTRLTEV